MAFPNRARWSTVYVVLWLAVSGVQRLAAQPPAPAPADGVCCYVVKDYWPFKTCKQECSPDVCKRGWGAWQNEDICCAPGVAFPEGCGKRPDECWVVESLQLRTCIRDDRKCLQGYGVWGSAAGCCQPGAAFPKGCRTDVVKAPQPCWTVDTYFPARLCRASDTLCTQAESGVQSWANREACCQQGAAFSEGCSAAAPQAPCWVVDSYWPNRRCRLENDIAACSRGWGVYQSEGICCAPNVAFPEGCSAPSTLSSSAFNDTALNSTLSLPAARAAIAAGVALTAPTTTAAMQILGMLSPPGAPVPLPPAPIPAAVVPPPAVTAAAPRP